MTETDIAAAKQNRLWRKNRMQYDADISFSKYYNQTCIGVDINRNFDFQWGTGTPQPLAAEPGNYCNKSEYIHQNIDTQTPSPWRRKAIISNDDSFWGQCSSDYSSQFLHENFYILFHFIMTQRLLPLMSFI